MNLKKRIEIFKRFEAQDPSPKTELKFDSHFELLIAVMLSAQATDISVNKATDKLFPIANTPESLLALGLDGLKSYIKSIGLYNTKAVNVLKTCQILVEQYHSCIPTTLKDLESLPGVGRKTANVVLNTAFNLPTMPVDTHVFRVANRTGLASGKTPVAIEQGLMKSIPKAFLSRAHHWLVLHGRYVCLARKPHCANCIISDLCQYKDKSI